MIESLPAVVAVFCQTNDCQHESPANDSQLTAQIISMLMVHKGYVFKLCPMQAWTCRSLLERRRNSLRKP